MRILNITNPDTKAEGLCNGLPYTTATYNKDGCTIHFWVGDCPLAVDVDTALRKAMNARDIIMASWSFGEPSGFWAHEDIE